MSLARRDPLAPTLDAPGVWVAARLIGTEEDSIVRSLSANLDENCIWIDRYGRIRRNLRGGLDTLDIQLLFPVVRYLLN